MAINHVEEAMNLTNNGKIYWLDVDAICRLLGLSEHYVIQKLLKASTDEQYHKNGKTYLNPIATKKLIVRICLSQGMEGKLFKDLLRYYFKIDCGLSKTRHQETRKHLLAAMSEAAITKSF